MSRGLLLIPILLVSCKYEVADSGLSRPQVAATIRVEFPDVLFEFSADSQTAPPKLGSFGFLFVYSTLTPQPRAWTFTRDTQTGSVFDAVPEPHGPFWLRPGHMEVSQRISVPGFICAAAAVFDDPGALEGTRLASSSCHPVPERLRDTAPSELGTLLDDLPDVAWPELITIRLDVSGGENITLFGERYVE